MWEVGRKNNYLPPTRLYDENSTVLQIMKLFEIEVIILEVYIFAGFMDSGKTSALQGVLLRNEILMERKSLILCTEEGEEEYDSVLLHKKNIEIEYVNDEDEITEEYLGNITEKHDVDYIYIEFNGTWDLKRLITETIPKAWEIVSVFSFVDATTYDLYLKNMRQVIMNPLSVSDVILFNRCTEATRKGDIRRSLKILNNRAEVHFTHVDGSLDDGIDELLLQDENGVLEIDDQLFCPWFVDCIENTDKYYGKKIRANVMTTFGNGLLQNQFYAGRMAAICCAEDAQFIGFVAECQGVIPKKGEWLDITATIKKGLIDNNKAIILLDIEEAKKIEQPEDIYLYF